MKEKTKVCLVSCSVLREELEKLVKLGLLDVDLVFVSKYFHVDYDAVEKNLRKVLEHTMKCSNRKVVLVYGDLCLGQDNEMKKLANEYGIVKVDAVNCIDCQLGGGGKFFASDPDHNLMFMGPGMIEFFKYAKETMLKEGINDEAFANMFTGIKGLVLLDTCGTAEKLLKELGKLSIALPVLETRQIGLEGVERVIFDAIERATTAK